MDIVFVGVIFYGGKFVFEIMIGLGIVKIGSGVVVVGVGILFWKIF